MIAKYENRSLNDGSHTSAHAYRNLTNIPHWHMEHELIFMSSGNAKVLANDRWYRLAEGEGVFVRSGDVHHIDAEAESITKVIKVDPELVKAIVGDDRRLPNVLERKELFEQAYAEILNETKGELAYSAVVADAVAVRLFALLFRSEKYSEEVYGKENGYRRYKELLKKIETEYAHLSFEEAAEYMNFSKPYFSKYFLRYTGIKFTRYINILKISSAIEKMSEGKESITDIAIACGFNTIRSFNRVFKEITGYAPRNLPPDHILTRRSSLEFGEGVDPNLSGTEILE